LARSRGAATYGRFYSAFRNPHSAMMGAALLWIFLSSLGTRRFFIIV